MKKFIRCVLPALLLALILVLSLTACEGRGDEPGASEQPPAPPVQITGAGPMFANPLGFPTGPGEQPAAAEFGSLAARARDLHSINSDTVGWLYVPNTSLDDVVLWYPNDYNVFYLRRDFYRRWSWEGVYFADFRTRWGGFTRGEISRNIVIYGHSMEDDPNGPLFSQFKRWKDEQWARSNPYVFFSTLEEDMVWEIFSVHFSNVWVPYNNPNPTDDEFQVLIDDAKARSLWNYDIDVTIDDTIITFSTCTYVIIPTYPNEYRFVIMARLVDDGTPLRDTVGLTRNPNPVDASVRP